MKATKRKAIALRYCSLAIAFIQPSQTSCLHQVKSVLPHQQRLATINPNLSASDVARGIRG